MSLTSDPSQQKRFLSILGDKYPMMESGLREARLADPVLVDRYFELTLGWMVSAFGASALERIADGYAFFTTEVNRAQAVYEKSGAYLSGSFAECNQRIYQNKAYMTHYYWGVYAILFCWIHYVELMRFYLDRFVARCGPGRLLEIAPGHGTWGLLAVHENQGLTLAGLDISPTFLDFAPALARAAGLAERTQYRCGDGTQAAAGDPFDYAVCCFMLEHLEDPAGFLSALSPQLRQGGRAFVTLALTAAQPDHIFEFKKESEALVMAEAAGFRVVEACCTWPKRLLKGARFVPRVQGMILEKL
jgi:2-polyprenyl-3-methyl-5-hydroxy-6-metoxy-1,4-benzoquinol methylase